MLPLGAPLRGPAQSSFDDGRGTVGGFLQRPGGQVGIPLGHRRVGVSQDLLHLIERPAAVDQERCILMPQVVDPQMGQSRLAPQPLPDLVDRGVGLPGLAVDNR